MTDKTFPQTAEAPTEAPTRTRRGRGRPRGTTNPAKTDLTAAYGERHRQLREAAGISQDDLAERAGLHRTAISLIERGQRESRLGTILRSAGGLGVEPAALLEGIAPVFRPPAAAIDAAAAQTVRREADDSLMERLGRGGGSNGRAASEPTDPVAIAFGRRLEDIRMGAKLSQDNISALTGLNRTEVSLIERGGRGVRVSTLLKLAGALRVKPSDLLVGVPRWQPVRGAPGQFIPHSSVRPKNPNPAPLPQPDTSAGTPVDLPDAPRPPGPAPAGDRRELMLRISQPPADASSRRFSEAVIWLRRGANLTQRQLSERAGIPRTELTTIELAGRMPDGPTILALASAFGIPPNSLVDGIPPERLPDEVRAKIDPTFSPTVAGLPVDLAGDAGADIVLRLATNTALLRHRAGMTQDQLAHASGVHRSAIAKIEVRKVAPTLFTVERLADALGVAPGVLLDRLLTEHEVSPE